jgi:hypothetical protein
VVALARVARAHWLFALVFAAGLGLRVLAQLAYRPALLYIDSVKYLAGSHGTEPEGYGLLLRLLDPAGGLAFVAAVQHVFGLATAVAVYLLLTRRQAPRWVAALAAAPVLLDAYQLQLEQTIMPDVLFETMIAAGLVVLLWRRRPSLPVVGVGAFVLGAATTVREIGAVLVVPAVLFALLSAGAGRAARAMLAGACFVLPVVGYMTVAYGIGGHFGLASNGPGPEYGRAATAADCATLRLPADERPLCPSPALVRALGGVDGLLHNPRSPENTVPVPPGVSREQLLARFSRDVVLQQPLRVAASVARDAGRLFALTRDGDPQVTSISRWQFQTSYPTYPRRYSLAMFTQLSRRAGSGAPAVNRPVAAALRAYQLHGGYTPGPVYAACLALGLLGSLAGLRRPGLLRRRLARRGLDREPGLACLLVTLSAVALLVSSDAFEFSWRYQLPAVVMLPLAGALGYTAVVSGITARRGLPAGGDGQTKTAILTAVLTATGGTGRRTRPASD